MMLTVKQVAERLSVSATCVYQLVTSGKLPHIRVGLGRGTIRVGESDLAVFIDQSRRGADPIAPTEEGKPRLRQFKHLRIGRGA